MALIDKINEFKTSLDDCKTSLKNKGVSVSKCTADVVASNINSIATTKSMGSKSVTFKQNTVTYGFSVTENEQDPEKRLVYLDDAKGMVSLSNDLTRGTCDYGTWKSSWIFEKVYPVMLQKNGTIGYRLDPDNQTLKATGGNSDISNITSYNGNAMVCIEKFYTKFSMNGENEEIRISNTKQDGYEAIGFLRADGTEVDCIYFSMFAGRYNNGIRSFSDQTITWNYGYSSSRKDTQYYGTDYDIPSYAMNTIFSTLITIFIKSCDWQKKLGNGRQYNKNAKTGALVSKGAFAYDSTNGIIKTLWVEDFLTSTQTVGQCAYHEIGIFKNANKLYVKMKPPYNDTKSDYTLVEDYIPSSNIYMKKMKCNNKYGRIPVAYDEDGKTYQIDTFNGNQFSDPAYSFRGGTCGLWGRHIKDNDIDTEAFAFARTTYLPPK